MATLMGYSTKVSMNVVNALNYSFASLLVTAMFASKGVTRALRKSTIRIVASELQNLRKSKYQNKYRSGTRMLTQQVPEPVSCINSLRDQPAWELNSESSKCLILAGWREVVNHQVKDVDTKKKSLKPVGSNLLAGMPQINPSQAPL